MSAALRHLSIVVNDPKRAAEAVAQLTKGNVQSFHPVKGAYVCLWPDWSGQFVEFYNSREWEKARKLLSDDFEAFWPQSRERIIGPDNFIELNRRYPGEHTIKIVNSMCEYDQWDMEFAVSTQVYIESKMPDGKEMKLYGASFFELDSDNFIKSATEYWADTCEPEAGKRFYEREGWELRSVAYKKKKKGTNTGVRP